ncbi:hypothetical protein RhiirA4_393487 [Rhizophagus irregularis]|uniref:Uncharacterized protein n=1 Tax=Rhizophagus irregularis TaxID=588596 RepID=A0A2I1FYK5_9GLOM|nr:hypothetical protein RhiirA4_393487 [Rhizophagus irregularis]
METMLADNNEAVRCEYISTVKRIADKELAFVDYAIKALEELICMTEGKLHQVTMGFAQNLVQCESALQVNKKKE